MTDTTRDSRLGLHRLVDANERFDALVRRYHTRQNTLHGSCFYDRIREPIRTIKRRIRETATYTDDAEQLAERSPDQGVGITRTRLTPSSRRSLGLWRKLRPESAIAWIRTGCVR